MILSSRTDSSLEYPPPCWPSIIETCQITDIVTAQLKTPKYHENPRQGPVTLNLPDVKK